MWNISTNKLFFIKAFNIFKISAIIYFNYAHIYNSEIIKFIAKIFM